MKKKVTKKGEELKPKVKKLEKKPEKPVDPSCNTCKAKADEEK